MASDQINKDLIFTFREYVRCFTVTVILSETSGYSSNMAFGNGYQQTAK
jgi:hypothetical protein